MPKARSAALEAAGLIERYGILGQTDAADDALAKRLRAENRQRVRMERIAFVLFAEGYIARARLTNSDYRFAYRKFVGRIERRRKRG